MDRETTTIKIDKHEFVVKTYLTAKENNTVQSAYFAGSKVEIVGQEPKISEFDPSVQYNVQKAMIEQMVVSMDGEADKLVERCENLPSHVFEELAIKLDQLAAKKN